MVPQVQFVPTLNGDVTTKKNNKTKDPVSDVDVEQRGRQPRN